MLSFAFLVLIIQATIKHTKQNGRPNLRPTWRPDHEWITPLLTSTQHNMNTWFKVKWKKESTVNTWYTNSLLTTSKRFLNKTAGQIPVTYAKKINLDAGLQADSNDKLGIAFNSTLPPWKPLFVTSSKTEM